MFILIYNARTAATPQTASAPTPALTASAPTAALFDALAAALAAASAICLALWHAHPPTAFAALPTACAALCLHVHTWCAPCPARNPAGTRVFCN